MTALAILLLLAISPDKPAARPSPPSRGPGTALPRPYPFAPYEDAELAATAARVERRLAGTTGVRLAVRAVCGPTPPPPRHRKAGSGDELHDYYLQEVERRVAHNFLIASADQAFPLLLDASRSGDRNSASKSESTCRTEAFRLMRAGICFGYELQGTTWSDLDALPLAVERRALSQRVLASLLAAGGPRSDVALDLLAENTGVCTGLPEAIRAATPTLVKLLGAPNPPVRIPVRATDSWDVAFRVLSFAGVDRALAEKPMAAFLEHDASAPLAALAIARMGGDATAALPRIARVIENVDVQVRPQAQLTQLGDAVDALVAIGKPARSALPSLAALLSHPDMPGCHSLGGLRFAQLVRAIATPADAAQAVAVLAPLIRCDRERALSSTERPVVELLGELGPPARGVLLSMFRDDTRLVSERLETLRLARNAGYLPGEGDQRLAKLLEHKRDNPPPRAPPPLPLASALAACRAEAGLPPAPVETPPDVPPVRDQSLNGFPICLAMYLCGPGPETYARTIRRCCHDAYREDLPAYCAAGPPAP